jgi:hypothetical protein
MTSNLDIVFLSSPEAAWISHSRGVCFRAYFVGRHKLFMRRAAPLCGLAVQQ